MNVLIVDDDEVDREHIKRILLKSNDSFDIVEADSVETGIALFDETKFDVILLDFSMPKRDGIELLIEFRGRPKESGSAIIMMSHSQDNALAAQCILEGAQDFIIKSEITEERLRRSIIYAKARFELELRLYQATQDKKNLEQKDALTGLANRYYFSQILSIALKNAETGFLKIGLVLIDIDNFKLINDSMGYGTGDQALIHLGSKLLTLLPQGTLLSRLGGDEFAYYFTYSTAFDSALNTVNQILQTTSSPVVLEDSVKLSMNVSMGISLSDNGKQTASELIRDAEIAMYRAKKQGGKQYCFFQESMQLQMRRRVDLENGLIRAIDDGDFILNYQPVYDQSGENLWGFEVLLRWEHNGERVSPDEFIVIAEETKLIQPIGAWVIDTAFSELVAWNAKLQKRLKLAINLSPVQLEIDAIDQYISDKLKQYNLDPALIEFEITETALLDFSESNIQAIDRIVALGCDISLDDFGTGFSSFTGLQRLPISVIKVDRSIMPKSNDDKANKKLFGALITMIDYLGLTAVAEGVETQEQYDYCRDIGVGRLQGFYMNKAAPLTDELMTKLQN